MVFKLPQYLNKDDSLGLLSVIFVFTLMILNTNSWGLYLSDLVFHLIIASPILLVQQTFIYERLSCESRGWVYLLCYVFYPIGVIAFFNTQTEYDNLQAQQIILILLAAKALFSLNTYFGKVKNNRQFGFVSKIGVDKWILSILMFVSIYLGLLIASDLPLWLASNAVAELNAEAIVSNPVLVLSMSVQLFLLFFCGFIFYWINKTFLIKHVFIKQGFIVYAVLLSGTLTALYPVLMQLHLWLPINSMASPIIPAVEADPFSWENGRVFLAVMLISIPFVLVSEWNRSREKVTLVEKEHTQTELQLLKQQIDPHFFLNTLNNLYALTRKKADSAPNVVLQLSEIMRYVVYRGQDPFVTIAEEINYIKDYLALQKIRFHQRITVTTNFQISDEHQEIAPLLFIIFVENAFKHGPAQSDKFSFIDLSLTTTSQLITFKCTNSTELNGDPIHDINFGLGLNNLKRRLELIYPGKHKLVLKQKENEFISELNIVLGNKDSTEDI